MVALLTMGCMRLALGSSLSVQISFLIIVLFVIAGVDSVFLYEWRGIWDSVFKEYHGIGEGAANRIGDALEKAGVNHTRLGPRTEGRLIPMAFDDVFGRGPDGPCIMVRDGELTVVHIGPVKDKESIGRLKHLVDGALG